MRRSTIILSLIAIVAIVGTMAYDHWGTPPGADGPVRLLTDESFPVDDIRRITLERRGEEKITIVERDGTWWQESPIVHPLDPHSVRRLVTLTSEMQGMRPSADFETGDVGLDDPAARLAFTWSGGTREVSFGRRGFAGRSYIGLSGDEGVWVVSGDLYDRAVDMDPKEWRDRTLFANVGLHPDRIEIVSRGQAVRIVRDRRTWRIDAPVKTRADTATTEALIQALSRAQSSGFILDAPSDLERFGLASPVGAVTVFTTPAGDGVEPIVERLFVGERLSVSGQDRYGLVEGRDVIVRISEPVLQAFFQPAAALAAPTGSGATAADVKSIRINGPGGDFRLERELDTWVALDHGNRVVDAEMVEQLLLTLTQMRAERVSFDTFNDRLAMITLFGFDQRPLDTVRIARKRAEDGDRWVFENGDNVLRILAPGVSLRITPEAFGLQRAAVAPDGAP